LRQNRAEQNLQFVPVQPASQRFCTSHCTSPTFRVIMRAGRYLGSTGELTTGVAARPGTNPRMESTGGRMVSHYELLEKLGAGGMGEIYKARDSRLNRIVAVQVLTPSRTRDPQRRRRFIQEAQAASGLNHPNIITIHDILSEGDTQYMVMEHVAGETLYTLIAAGPMPLGECLQIGAQIANALAAAHAAGIVHRDLKPANVMITGSGLVKVLDFGLAKLTDPPATAMQSQTVNGAPDSSATLTAAPISASPLTAEGSIMGTVNYMSPEQAEGLKVDARSDIFSFGAVFYEMITGQRAFEGDSGISTLSAVLRDEVKPIRETVPDIPPEIEDLAARCLRKNPAERWASMGEVAAVLTRLRARLESGSLQPASSQARSLESTAAPSSIKAAKPAAPPPGTAASEIGPQRNLLIAACAALLVVALAVGIWWKLHRSSDAPKATEPVTTAAVPPQSQPTPALAVP